MKSLVIFIFCAICVLSFSSLKPKDAKINSNTVIGIKNSDVPEVGEDVAGLTGQKITNFSVEEEFTKAGISRDLKNDVLAGRLCAFIYDPAPNNSNLCRYIVIYDCFTGTIYSVTTIP